MQINNLVEAALPVVDYLQHHPQVAWGILFAGAMADSTIGLCFFFFGELFFLAGAMLAGAGHLSMAGVALSCYAGAFLGDHISYWIGRFWKDRVMGFLTRFSLLKKGLEKARQMLQEYGDKGVFLGRLAGPVAWVLPFLCGTAHTPYFRFARYNFFGVILGVGQFLLLGYSITSGTIAFVSEKKFLFVWALIPWIVGFFFIRRILKKHVRLHKKAPLESVEDNPAPKDRNTFQS